MFSPAQLASLLNVNYVVDSYVVDSYDYVVGAMVYWLSLLHKFIQQSLNSDSGQVQTLLMACQRFVMVRISENGPGWK